jgi:GMP synthase-like glutamine amidotransferase
VVRVLSLTHGPLVRSQILGDVVRDEGHELVEWDIVEQGVPPDGFAAVMVFGGDMNVGEEAAHPWLWDEYELLREWAANGTPLLGVCLGAQTLAHAAGARVTPVARPQIGFQDVALTQDGERDPVLGVLPSRFRALEGHRYAFEVPDGAEELATSTVSPQAFRLGERAWGVQFHPEVRRDQVVSWWAHEGEDLPRPLAELEAELDAELDRWQELGRVLCRGFLARAR